MGTSCRIEVHDDVRLVMDSVKIDRLSSDINGGSITHDEAVFISNTLLMSENVQFSHDSVEQKLESIADVY